MSVFYGRALTATAGGGGKPKFTYTGTYEYIDDGGGNWRIKFLSSGVFTPLKKMTIDVFLVGGGGGGAGSNSRAAASGGSTSAFGLSVNGGSGATNSVAGHGGSGGGAPWPVTTLSGTGGDGGANGGNGEDTYISERYKRSGGAGQGSTTREFGEPAGDLYAGGGGGGGMESDTGAISAGGAGGGGRGGYQLDSANRPYPGTANTGGGGGGNSGDKGFGGGGGYTATYKTQEIAAGSYPIVIGAGGAGGVNDATPTRWSGADGGSGIVIIRKHKEVSA